MVRVFAVEPAAVQLAWPSLPPGPHRLSARGDDGVVAEAAVAGDGGPGAGLLDGLTSGASADIEPDGRRAARATTLEPPPGRLLGRLATIGDLHLGETRFGVLP